MKLITPSRFQRLVLLLAAVMLALPLLAPLGQAEAARQPGSWTGVVNPAGEVITVQRVSWSSGPQ